MNQKRTILYLIIPTILLFICINLYYFWVKVGGSIFMWTGIVELILILFSISMFIHLLEKVVSKKEWRNKNNYFSLALFLFISGILFYKGILVTENTFQSKVILKANYQGTVNGSTLLLRKNKTFEDFNIGFFAYVHYYQGTWKYKGDTILLHFAGQRSLLLGDTLIIKDRLLYKIQADTLVSTFYRIDRYFHF